MAKSKYIPASDDIQQIVDEVAEKLNLPNFGVECEAIVPVKAPKEVCKIVRANDLTEYKSNKIGTDTPRDHVFVICYEEVFDLATDQQKYIWIKTAMDVLSYDSEKDKLITKAPMIVVPECTYTEFKGAAIDAAIAAHLMIGELEVKKKQEEEERKALRTATRKKSKN